MDYDFALITLKDSGASAGYMGMDYGNGGSVTLNLTTAGYPVRLLYYLYDFFILRFRAKVVSGSICNALQVKIPP